MNSPTTLYHLLELGQRFLEAPTQEDLWTAFIESFEEMRRQNRRADEAQQAATTDRVTYSDDPDWRS